MPGVPLTRLSGRVVMGAMHSSGDSEIAARGAVRRLSRGAQNHDLRFEAQGDSRLRPWSRRRDRDLARARLPLLEIAGITTVGGNQTLEKVTRNARVVATLAGIEAPIAAGAQGRSVPARSRWPPRLVPVKPAWTDRPICRNRQFRWMGGTVCS